MRQRGFISAALLPYLAIGAGLVILILWGWGSYQSSRADDAIEEKARVLGEFNGFKTEVRRIGEKAEKERQAEELRVKRENDNAIERWKIRTAAANNRADELCKRAGLSAGCSDLSRIPDTTRPPDDTARDQRLLEVLRHAQKQVDQLIEFQEWQRGVRQGR